MYMCPGAVREARSIEVNIACLCACVLLQVQAEGPYLLGGHSYGGLVAMEVAAVLESWGHDVGLVLIMDTPRPEQVRRHTQTDKYTAAVE
jgi:thioesterase domain-containing protein